VLLIMLLFGVLQVAALFYVRSVVSAAAADGARYAANADVPSTDGAQRASNLIRQGLGAGMASRLTCTAGSAADASTGLATAQVRCQGQIRSMLVPIGAFVRVDVTARSLKEGPG
jgi:Flp pilus assembly protein TadG